MNTDQSWRGKGRITFRSILIGVVLIPLNYLWIVQLELVRYSLVTYLVPYYTVIFIITVLILCNGSLGKFSDFLYRISSPVALVGRESFKKLDPAPLQLGDSTRSTTRRERASSKTGR